MMFSIDNFGSDGAWIETENLFRAYIYIITWLEYAKEKSYNDENNLCRMNNFNDCLIIIIRINNFLANLEICSHSLIRTYKQ